MWSSCAFGAVNDLMGSALLLATSQPSRRQWSLEGMAEVVSMALVSVVLLAVLLAGSGAGGAGGQSGENGGNGSACIWFVEEYS
jgi:hypothetical protein